MVRDAAPAYAARFQREEPQDAVTKAIAADPTAHLLPTAARRTDAPDFDKADFKDDVEVLHAPAVLLGAGEAASAGAAQQRPLRLDPACVSPVFFGYGSQTAPVAKLVQLKELMLDAPGDVDAITYQELEEVRWGAS